MKEEEIEFLKESNAIEREYSEEALEDAKHAWNFAKKHRHKFDIEFIKLIHQELMRRLNPRIAGKIRKCDIWVGGRKGYNPEEIIEELQIICDGQPLNGEAAKYWHIQFEKIHPFEDGNGRVGRILMNIQRLKIDLPLLIIHEGEEQQRYYRWFK